MRTITRADYNKKGEERKEREKETDDVRQDGQTPSGEAQTEGEPVEPAVETSCSTQEVPSAVPTPKTTPTIPTPVKVGGPGAKTKTPASPHKEIPVDKASGRLSAIYFHGLGSRPSQHDAACTKWPKTFTALLRHESGAYTEEKLAAAFEMGFKHPYWSKQMDRFKGDPVEWICQLENIDALLRDLDRAQREANKPQSSAPRGTVHQFNRGYEPLPASHWLKPKPEEIF